MAASGVGRTFQVVRPHIPLIKFKSPGSITAATPVTSDAGLQMLSMPAVSPQVQTGTSTLAPTYVKPVGNTPRGSGISDQDLPQKYRRKPIEEDEIAYILRGGPE